MTLSELVSKVTHPPSGMNITLDNRLNEPDFTKAVIREKRALIIERAARQRGDIPPLWHQPYIVKKVDKYDKNEDIWIDLERDLGKFNLPRLIQFKYRNQSNQNKALISIVDAKSGKRYFPTSYEKWKVIQHANNEMSKSHYYFMVGDTVYLTKYTDAIIVKGIFFDPLKAHIIDNTLKQSGSLIIGETYQVKNGSIVHNGSSVSAPNQFIAQAETYTGEGLVYPVEKYRLLRDTDPYPFNDSFEDDLKKFVWNEFNLAISSPKDNEGNADEEAYRQNRSSDE